MITEIISTEGDQIRFCVNLGNSRIKIFSIFRAASDGSLAFHDYFKGNIIGELNSDSIENGQTFLAKDAEFKDFKVHKFNFHKSGTVTVKDKTGNRPNDDYSSIDFRKIPDAITLFVYQLTQLEKYPIISDQKEYYDLIQGNKAHLPPNVQVILSKKSYDLKSDFEEKNDSILFINSSILSQYDLNLCINVRKHSSGKYADFAVLTTIKY
ncbi:hypothetical protein [Mangrovimonas xylaniphaga]|uniref:hypothetical protein n=1 Tax=Mangrovimonas xylaniphaga TaxID=1645915 RepID=UPI0006B653CD|nr:hypothetical protein [Mangrovimonas xylaniphaga]